MMGLYLELNVGLKMGSGLRPTKMKHNIIKQINTKKNMTVINKKTIIIKDK